MHLVALLPFGSIIFPSTVAENVRFGPRQQGQDLNPSEIDALLAEVELERFANPSEVRAPAAAPI